MAHHHSPSAFRRSREDAESDGTVTDDDCLSGLSERDAKIRQQWRATWTRRQLSAERPREDMATCAEEAGNTQFYLCEPKSKENLQCKPEDQFVVSPASLIDVSAVNRQFNSQRKNPRKKGDAVSLPADSSRWAPRNKDHAALYRSPRGVDEEGGDALARAAAVVRSATQRRLRQKDLPFSRAASLHTRALASAPQDLFKFDGQQYYKDDNEVGRAASEGDMMVLSNVERRRRLQAQQAQLPQPLGPTPSTRMAALAALLLPRCCTATAAGERH
ncbi:hypothetical protein M885DRAFT_523108 [Pelagophyceae sp. CCMP2097]|nr:hypothetical protein M885DRAFT_523108 [Pelagophyceae sp. CCMP2097]|mmetsp:Transcript_19691/g.66604  ORF Transcript_19691/g.66604 Transcript_19691/m.66604 type:complete len:274 (+) Transcript_19691:186-1007(+)